MVLDGHEFLDIFTSVQKKATDNCIPNTRIIATKNSVALSLEAELCTNKINDIRKYLWWAGLPGRFIKPLHHQRVVGRNIVVSENIGLHLVCRGPNIYVKPLPRTLLHRKFFEDWISTNQKWTAHAYGFLSTYLRMIRYESDLHVANELHLLPCEVGWDQWIEFSRALENCLRKHCSYGSEDWSFDNRFDFGELRLSRLNNIATFCLRNPRGYIQLDHNYAEYFQAFSTLITALFFATLSIVLSAFQVALGSGNVNDSTAVVCSGYWFSIITLFLVGTYIVAQSSWFLLAFLHNLQFSLSFAKRQNFTGSSDRFA